MSLSRGNLLTSEGSHAMNSYVMYQKPSKPIQFQYIQSVSSTYKNYYKQKIWCYKLNKNSCSEIFTGGIHIRLRIRSAYQERSFRKTIIDPTSANHYILLFLKRTLSFETVEYAAYGRSQGAGRQKVVICFYM